MQMAVHFSWLLFAVLYVSACAVNATALPYISQWSQLDDDYLDPATLQWLDQIKNVVRMHDLDNVKRSIGGESTDLGFDRARAMHKLMNKLHSMGHKRAFLWDLSSLTRRRAAEQP